MYAWSKAARSKGGESGGQTVRAIEKAFRWERSTGEEMQRASCYDNIDAGATVGRGMSSTCVDLSTGPIPDRYRGQWHRHWCQWFKWFSDMPRSSNSAITDARILNDNAITSLSRRLRGV
uniref:Uncharacterized protein n=1 Tax=Vespula pensylvanica TaxID=30213 RepID=A0A834PIV1_VESPE|nr:hypothetical protein H0235_001812 [Vespula pensylvanica]